MNIANACHDPFPPFLCSKNTLERDCQDVLFSLKTALFCNAFLFAITTLLKKSSPTLLRVGSPAQKYDASSMTITFLLAMLIDTGGSEIFSCPCFPGVVCQIH